MIVIDLAGALERAAAALESDDTVAASAALTEAQRACARAEAQGLRLEVAELESIGELHRRGEAAAKRAADKLARALGSAGSARRAVGAYRR